MPIIQSPYRAPSWLPGCHLQTCVPALLYRQEPLEYERQTQELPDGDFMLFDWTKNIRSASSDTPILVHFHGLEGSSQAHYSLPLMKECIRRGWIGCVPNLRGCGGIINRLKRMYHPGDSVDCNWVLNRIHNLYPKAPLYAVGVSLGGNLLTRCLGDLSEGLAFVRAAVSIGAPLDLSIGIPALEKGFCRVYTIYFMRTLRKKLLEKCRLFPQVLNSEIVQQLCTISEMDAYYTARFHGFRSVAEYYFRSSAIHVLRQITRPLLLLNALNDPFYPGRYLPSLSEVSDSVYLEYSREGGHCGFASNRWGDLSYLPSRVFDFFSRF